MSHDTVEAEVIEAEVVPPRKDYSQVLTRAERDQLKALSTEIFGKSSKWQTMYEYKYFLTHKVQETVPGENGAPDTEKEVEVPLLYNGSKQWRVKYRTTEEVLQLLQDFKTRRDAYLEQARKAQEEAKLKADEEAKAKKIQEDLGGSALT